MPSHRSVKATRRSFIGVATVLVSTEQRPLDPLQIAKQNGLIWKYATCVKKKINKTLLFAALYIFDMAQKEALWEAYYEGFDVGKHVEELDEIQKRTARSKFEQWYSVNFE